MSSFVSDIDDTIVHIGGDPDGKPRDHVITALKLLLKAGWTGRAWSHRGADYAEKRLKEFGLEEISAADKPKHPYTRARVREVLGLVPDLQFDDLELEAIPGCLFVWTPRTGDDAVQAAEEAQEREILHTQGQHKYTVPGTLQVKDGRYIWTAKYSDDQPRDDHGRFTSGGGGSDAPGIVNGSFTSPEQFYATWKTGLSSSERMALGEWRQIGGFTSVNDYLRGKWQLASDAVQGRQIATLLSRAISSAPPLPSDVTVYRQFAAAQFGDLHVGDVITDKGFVATAVDPSGATSWGQIVNANSSPTMGAEITLPEGTRAAGISEHEVLVDSGSSFRVTSVASGDNFDERLHFGGDIVSGLVKLELVQR